jgi:hypothetical protein
MYGHAILVCFTVSAQDMEQAQKQLMTQLPNCNENPGVAGIDSWYIAMSERYDGTTPADGCSAVFEDPDEVTVRIPYDDAICMYDLLRGDVCKSEMVNPQRRERAAKWASTILDAIDRYERGGV